MSSVPVDLYVATYSDPGAAQEDWDDIKQLARDDVIAVDGLVPVSRNDDGKIEVKDNANDVGRSEGEKKETSRKMRRGLSIVALRRAEGALEKALAKADSVDKHEVDADSAQDVKAAASS